jgi:hypothetical protein
MANKSGKKQKRIHKTSTGKLTKVSNTKKGTSKTIWEYYK